MNERFGNHSGLHSAININASLSTKVNIPTLHCAKDGAPDSLVEPEMYLYRERTTALVRKYCRLSLELGRVPSLLGREFFRSRVTSYRMHNFEDVVIFVYDVERCLGKLDGVSRALIARIVMQEYTQEEAARMLGYNPRTVERKYPEALDRLTSILLEAELLREVDALGPQERKPSRREQLPPKKTVRRVEACQEGESAAFAVLG
jgi:hypothetical protein